MQSIEKNRKTKFNALREVKASMELKENPFRNNALEKRLAMINQTHNNY